MTRSPAQEHMLLLGRKNAEERPASLPLDMADRSSTEHMIDLPMSRQEIADIFGCHRDGLAQPHAATGEFASATARHFSG